MQGFFLEPAPEAAHGGETIMFRAIEPVDSKRARPLGRVLALSLALTACAAGFSALSAQEPSPAPVETSASGPKITIHGFLSQAYAKSDGHQILGIASQGTADYRSAALQIRAEISPNDVFAVQLNHERLGKSPVMSIKSDVELDWIFYEHRFGDSAVKVGRVQIPFGVYNEVLDVGTILPFYRPSRNFYGETAYSSETVDGVALTHTFNLAHDWSVDGDVYFGNLQFPERNFVTGGYVKSGARNARGAEVWVDTPMTGVRVGAGGLLYEIDSLFSPGTWKTKHLSLSVERKWFDVHSDYKWVDLGLAKLELGYVQAGIHFTEKLRLNAQQDFFYSNFTGRRARDDSDRALGLNYAFNPSLVLKAEHHWTEGGFWLEDQIPFGAPTPKTRYWILSLATSF
jgi:hypothetical protein